ncbi:MAG: hypothetical protein GC160_15900 [Acidobacteria bacterium]|nr:hypothetical protein [Acidobacteriota bacterium]
MLRRSFTAVLEKNAVFDGDFATEPYEVGWASEARFFVRVRELSEGARLLCRPQISPDGLFWCDEGAEGVSIAAPGLYSFAVREFGNWLRLDCPLDGRAKLLIYLALK